MIVVDASVIVDLLLDPRTVPRLEAVLRAADEAIIAPHLIDVEVTQAFRRFVRSKELPADFGLKLIERMVLLPLGRIPHAVLLRRAWELRENFTAYDATYIALAEMFQATLMTRDQKLASTPGHRAKIVAI